MTSGPTFRRGIIAPGRIAHNFAGALAVADTLATLRATDQVLAEGRVVYPFL